MNKNIGEHLKDYTIRKNRVNPKMIYSYEKKVKGRVFTIFTMNSGKTFHVTIEDKWKENQRRCVELLSKYTCDSINESLYRIEYFNVMYAEENP